MKKRILVWALVLMLLCPACSGRRGNQSVNVPSEGQYRVYFLTDPEQPGESGSVPDCEFRSVPAHDEAVESLVGILLSGPESSSLRSPFPQGTTCLGWQLEEGLLTLDLSEAYGGLSGVDLTLADACATLTLCQLEEVERVYLTVEGRPRPFRDQVLTPGQFLLEMDSTAPSNGIEGKTATNVSR